MKYQYWECKICGKKFRTDTGMAGFIVEEHLFTHEKQKEEYQNAGFEFRVEEKKLEEKFNKRYLGYWIKNITPPVVRKFWNCPVCKEDMIYNDKYWHISNFHDPILPKKFRGELPPKTSRKKPKSN